MNWLENLSKSFKTSIPWIIASVGFVLLIIGELLAYNPEKGVFLEYSKDKIPDIISGLGKVILISGVTTITLNSYKFLGIFKDELSKIISGDDVIGNRKDLDSFWEKISKHMFKNKFPTINKQIIKDVKDIYLPTESVQYYNDYKQITEISLVDKEKQIVKVTQTSKFTIVPVESKTKFSHDFINTISCKKFPELAKFEIVKFKVNDKDQQHNHQNITKENCLISKYNVTLEGNAGYNIEIQVSKQYSLLDDNMIATLNVYIRNNFNAQFFLKGVSLDFYEAGTLNKFKTINDRPELLEMNYDGLIYPKQGYIGIIKLL